MEPLVNNTYLLEKFEGKGGWTYAVIPEIIKDKNRPFGWVKVKGMIDEVPLNKYHLMPLANGGGLFLPVKADIRKKIGKEAGDKVRIVLYPDTDPLEIPGEMQLCLQDEPQALKFFNSLSESERKYYMQWIYAAKKEETKTDRLAKTINKLLAGLKFHER